MSTLSVSQVKPLPGYVLVEPASAQKQTASGIILPDSHDEKPQHGTVLAISEFGYLDDEKIPCPVKKGDQVIYKKWGGNEIKFGDVEYQFLKFDDILASIGSSKPAAKSSK
jgi:chaperonin GroES